MVVHTSTTCCATQKEKEPPPPHGGRAGGRVEKPDAAKAVLAVSFLLTDYSQVAMPCVRCKSARERERFFTDKLLVRTEMVWWTGLAP